MNLLRHWCRLRLHSLLQCICRQIVSAKKKVLSWCTGKQEEAYTVPLKNLAGRRVATDKRKYRDIINRNSGTFSVTSVKSGKEFYAVVPL